MFKLLRSSASVLSRSCSSRKLSSYAAPLLVTPEQVIEQTRSNPSAVSVIDSSWFIPGFWRDARAEFLAKRIPGAQYLDLDQVASPNKLGLTHMMPTPQIFASACESLGISRTSHVVIYDTQGIFSAPRALFMFRTFGHTNSSVLDGGLPRWVDEGFLLETSAPSKPRPGSYPLPQRNKKAIRSYEQMVVNSEMNTSASEIVLDARRKERFTGEDVEPRSGISSGHIPNSYSLPFDLFLRYHKARDGEEYGTFLPTSDLRKLLDATIGSEESDKLFRGEGSVITSCGSGMTAAVLWLGLQLLGVPRVSLYDESWTGYAMRPASKIEKGP